MARICLARHCRFSFMPLLDQDFSTARAVLESTPSQRFMRSVFQAKAPLGVRWGGSGEGHLQQ